MVAEGDYKNNPIENVALPPKTTNKMSDMRWWPRFM